GVQTEARVEFTFTDFVTRVPVTLPVTTAIGTPGPNLICHDPYVPGTQSVYSFAGDLKGSLLTKVTGKSAHELTQLLADVQTASGRSAKFQALFGVMLGPGPFPQSYPYQLTDAEIRLLQMGQEVGDSKLADTRDGVKA